MTKKMAPPETVAKGVIQLLSAKPGMYTTFGKYWFFIKAFVKKMGYTKENLYLLGDYEDQEVVRRCEEAIAGLSLEDSLRAALEEHRYNARYGMGSNQFHDDDTGEDWVLFDADASF